MGDASSGSAIVGSFSLSIGHMPQGGHITAARNRETTPEMRDTALVLCSSIAAVTPTQAIVGKEKARAFAPPRS